MPLTVSNRSKTTDKTLEAIASCLFGALHANDANKVLDQAAQVMGKLHAQSSPALDTILCENAASFFTRFNEKDGGRQKGANQNGANREEKEMEEFSDQIILALLSRDLSATPTEFARRTRIDLASALARSHVVSQASRNRLAQSLDSWLSTERSRPLRDEITRVAEANKNIS